MGCVVAWVAAVVGFCVVAERPVWELIDGDGVNILEAGTGDG